MKKSIYLIITLCIACCFILTGCQSNEIKESENSSKAAETKNDVNKTAKTSNDKTKEDETLKPTEFKEKYDRDLPMGVEVRHVTVNGNDVAVNIQTSGSSKQQANGPYYIYYEVRTGQDIGQNKFKLVKEGIYHLEGFGVEMLKTFDMEEDAGVNYEFFEADFTNTACKGTDKEYVAISIPAGTEDKSQASFILATDEGDLVAEFTADIVKDVTLTGKNAERYKDHSGNIVFYSIKDGKVTYLLPSEKMYKKDSNGKKVLDKTIDVLELEEYTVTVNKNKATSKKTGEIYKITNAKDKTFGFGTFRH